MEMEKKDITPQENKELEAQPQAEEALMPSEKEKEQEKKKEKGLHARKKALEEVRKKKLKEVAKKGDKEGEKMGSENPDKPKNLMGTWKKILVYGKRFTPLLIIAVVFSAAGTVLSLVSPGLLSAMTNIITAGLKPDASGVAAVDMEQVFHIGVFLVILYIISSLLSALEGWIMAYITLRFSQKLRKDISQKINKLPMSFYNDKTIGDTLSRVTNDVDTISGTMNQSISTLISALIMFVGSLVLMIMTNGLMTLAAVGATILGFVIIFLIMIRSQKHFEKQQKCLGEIDGHIEEMFSGHTVVKAFNGEEASQAKFDQLNEELRHNGFMAQCLSGLMLPLMSLVGSLGYVAVCVVGGSLVLDHKITFGAIVAFLMYVSYFSQPLTQLAEVIQSLQQAAAAGERVFEFLEAEEMPEEEGKLDKLENVKGEVTFEHVKFGYDPEKVIIHDFSAKAAPGQKIAIVGPTGAGKTTLVNLLMRFFEVQGGQICIDGIPTDQIRREVVRSQFCMVLQDTWLFEGTIRENLIYSTPDATEEKMKEACKAAGLDYFIATLPEGYDTVLNEQMTLSQGQKQQLTIARAMIADRPMLILDEATSSVDTRTELLIQKAMDKLMENRTSFVIAHRLSTIKNADLILVLKDGDVVESGRHEELMQKNGFYADLYNSQFDQEQVS